MNKTYIPAKKEIKSIWYLIDAKDKILGRLATRAAILLRGKHKPHFTPYMDTGDGVIVINASKIKVTGDKLEQKMYKHYSGYPSGLKQTPLKRLLAKKPEAVIRLAVKRMLPKGPLGRSIFKRLKVYPNEQHAQGGQRPKVFKV